MINNFSKFMILSIHTNLPNSLWMYSVDTDEQWIEILDTFFVWKDDQLLLQLLHQTNWIILLYCSNLERDLNQMPNSVDSLKPSPGWDNHLKVLLNAEQINVVRNGLESFISQQGVFNQFWGWLSHIYTFFPLCP